MVYKSYDAYESTNITWIGKIPCTWEVTKLKYLLNNISGGCWGKDIENENGTIVLRSTEITLDGKWQINNPAKRLLTPIEINNCLLKEGDLLVTKSSGSEKHIGKTALVTKDVENLKCCFSNFMTRLHTNDKFLPKLMYYLLNSIIVKSQFNYISNSTVGLSNLNDDSFKNLLIPLSDIKTQNDIVSFLDKKTAKIDATIAKNEELIQLLEEKRVALINQVVTKGLNPDAPMKDSGVEWIGEIPEDWEIRKFGNLIKLITKGATPTSYGFDFKDEGINFIKVESIEKNGKFVPTKFNYISQECNNFLSRSKIKEGDLLFSIAGALGRVAIADSTILPANTNQALSIIRIDTSRLLVEYVFYALKSDYSMHQIDDNTVQSAQANLSMESIKKFKILIPSLNEQNELSAYLNKETLKIDSIIHKVQENITLLEEYKTSLIHHVVTGKIDVRGEEI